MNIAYYYSEGMWHTSVYNPNEKVTSILNNLFLPVLREVVMDRIAEYYPQLTPESRKENFHEFVELECERCYLTSNYENHKHIAAIDVDAYLSIFEHKGYNNSGGAKQ
jgi:hypothetical protein